MEAVAKHEFQATAEDELSFKKGSILKVSRSQNVFLVQTPLLNINKDAYTAYKFPHRGAYDFVSFGCRFRLSKQMTIKIGTRLNKKGGWDLFQRTTSSWNHTGQYRMQIRVQARLNIFLLCGFSPIWGI